MNKFFIYFLLFFFINLPFILTNIDFSFPDTYTITKENLLIISQEYKQFYCDSLYPMSKISSNELPNLLKVSNSSLPNEYIYHNDSISKIYIEDYSYFFDSIEKIINKTELNRDTVLPKIKKWINNCNLIICECIDFSKLSHVYQINKIIDTIITSSITKNKSFLINFLGIIGTFITIISFLFPRFRNTVLRLTGLRHLLDKYYMKKYLYNTVNEGISLPFINNKVSFENIYINLSVINNNNEIFPANRYYFKEKRILLVGNPGTGKSTMIKDIVNTHLNLQSKYYKYIFIINLNTFQEDNFVHFLNDNISRIFNHKSNYIFYSKSALFIFDGYDELDIDSTSKFNTFLKNNDINAIVTSRLYSYDKNKPLFKSLNFIILYISELSDIQISKYTRAYCRATNSKINLKEFHNRLKIQDALEKISRVPQFLSMLLFYNKEYPKNNLPSTLTNLYSEILEFHKDKFYTLPDSNSLEIDSRLSELSYKLFKKEIKNKGDVESYFISKSFESGIKINLLNIIMSRTAILFKTNQEAGFDFFHKSVSDYYLALYYVSNSKDFVNDIKIIINENPSLLPFYFSLHLKDERSPIDPDSYFSDIFSEDFTDVERVILKVSLFIENSIKVLSNDYFIQRNSQYILDIYLKNERNKYLKDLVGNLLFHGSTKIGWNLLNLIENSIVAKASSKNSIYIDLLKSFPNKYTAKVILNCYFKEDSFLNDVIKFDDVIIHVVIDEFINFLGETKNIYSEKVMYKLINELLWKKANVSIDIIESILRDNNTFKGFDKLNIIYIDLLIYNYKKNNDEIYIDDNNIDIYFNDKLVFIKHLFKKYPQAKRAEIDKSFQHLVSNNYQIIKDLSIKYQLIYLIPCIEKNHKKLIKLKKIISIKIKNILRTNENEISIIDEVLNQSKLSIDWNSLFVYITDTRNNTFKVIIGIMYVILAAKLPLLILFNVIAFLTLNDCLKQKTIEKKSSEYYIIVILIIAYIIIILTVLTNIYMLDIFTMLIINILLIIYLIIYENKIWVEYNDLKNNFPILYEYLSKFR